MILIAAHGSFMSALFNFILLLLFGRRNTPRTGVLIVSEGYGRIWKVLYQGLGLFVRCLVSAFCFVLGVTSCIYISR